MESIATFILRIRIERIMRHQSVRCRRHRRMISVELSQYLSGRKATAIDAHVIDCATKNLAERGPTNRERNRVYECRERSREYRRNGISVSIQGESISIISHRNRIPRSH